MSDVPPEPTPDAGAASASRSTPMTDFRFDPFDEPTRRAPWNTFARARRERPVFRHEGLPVTSIFKHADCQQILKDPSTWSNRFPPPPGMEDIDRPPSMLGMDPPEHSRLRGLVSQAFTPRMVKRMEPRLRAIAAELVDAAVARREVDMVDALTYPLPVIVIAEILGVPPADRAQFKAWSDAIVANLGLVVFQPPSRERLESFVAARGALEDYFRVLVDERRRRPQDDLLSGLVQAELEGSRLSSDELMAMLVLLLVAGNETTTNLIGNAVLELLAHPEQLATLRADRGLGERAVQEVLRFSSPVQMDPRFATRDVELRGVTIPAGTFALCWLGSANRDEEAFDRAEVFDVTRALRDQRHLAFGFGPHYCLGASLAALEAEVALDVLLARTRAFHRPDDAPLPLHPSIVFRGVRSLPLVLEPA
jgi:cytochrome P450